MVVAVVDVVVVDVCSHSLSSNALLHAGRIFYIHKHTLYICIIYLKLKPIDHARVQCNVRSVYVVLFCVYVARPLLCTKCAPELVMSFCGVYSVLAQLRT